MEETASSEKTITPKRRIKDVISLKCSECRSYFANFLEDTFVSVLFLLLSHADMILGSMSLAGGVQPRGIFSSTGIQNLQCIILHAQLFELLLQLLIFSSRFFGHWGYAFDTVLVAARMLSLHGVLHTNHLNLHLLSFLRVWRFVQVVQAHVRVEVSQHRKAMKELAKSAEDWKEKAKSMREDVEREKQVSRSSQELVKACQDEMEVMRHALEIAAEDVAARREHDDSNQDDDDLDIIGLGINLAENNDDGQDDDDGVEDRARVTPVPKEAEADATDATEQTKPRSTNEDGSAMESLD